MADKQKVAFLGLGVMGFPMAGHLANAGHQVTVYNRTAAGPRPGSRNTQGQRADTPAAAAEGAAIVFACVGNDDDLRSSCMATRARSPACARAPSSSTTRRPRPRSRARSPRPPASAGSISWTRPVSGGQAGAENGKLTVMVGGEPGRSTRAKPVIDSYARACVLMGPTGSGQLAKMVNQICIAGLLQGLAEG